MSEEVEMPLDIKTDIEIAFNLMKNENNKINKLKLRTLLFSFVMYKYSAYDINKYIETKTTPNQEIFTFDEVCYLINEKLKEARERESDELFNYIAKNKGESGKMSNKDLEKIYKNYELGVDVKELDKMIEYMIKKSESENDVLYVEENEDEDEEQKKDDKHKKIKYVTRNQFKKFYTETK